MSELSERLRRAADSFRARPNALLMTQAADHIDALEAADFPDVDPVTGDEAETQDLAGLVEVLRRRVEELEADINQCPFHGPVARRDLP